jgi:hypothetical protein
MTKKQKNHVFKQEIKIQRRDNAAIQENFLTCFSFFININ